MNKQLARNLLRAMVRAQVRLARLLHPGSDAGEAVFRHAWNALHQRRLIAWCASRTAQRFQPDVPEALLIEVLEAMKSQGISIQPRHQLQGSDSTLALLDSGRAPLIVVTSHTGFSATTQTLLRKGLAVTLVADALPSAELAARYRRTIEQYPTFQPIPKDRYSLGRLRDALRDGRTISCAADFQDEATRTYSLISPAIFEFASRVKAGLVMSKTIVNDDGSITTLLAGPHDISDALAGAKAFIDFLNAGRRTSKRLRIAHPTQD